MRKRSPSWIRLALTALLCLSVAAALSGCCAPGTKKDTGTTRETTSTPSSEDSPTASSEDSPTPGSTEDSPTAVVPNVIGKYYDDAAKVLMDAGFQPVDVPIHGPVDSDAGEIGKIYRQTPAAGQELPMGTKIELRSWWESQ